MTVSILSLQNIFLFFRRLIFFTLLRTDGCDSMWVCAVQVSADTQRGQQHGIDPLDLELQMAAGFLICWVLGTEPGSFRKSNKCT